MVGSDGCGTGGDESVDDREGRGLHSLVVRCPNGWLFG